MVELVDYSVSYGECIGFCTSVLTIDAPDIGLVQTSNGPDADVRRFTGEIDAGLSQTIADEAANVDQGNLRPTYGTPDARDEGAVTMRFRDRDGVTRHTYSRGGPPNELLVLDSFLSPILVGWIDGDPPEGVRFDESS